MLEKIEGFFGEVEYYDFPSFEVALFSILLAFLLSSLVAMVYKWTYRKEDFPNSFFQAMVLSSTVSAMIMMAVGNNLAVGFGIIGAVAIIRFRTNIQNPRNIIFMFESISIGIATGVYGYAVAVAGTLIFCSIALIMSRSEFQNDQERFELNVYYREHKGDFDAIIASFCKHCFFQLERINAEGVIREEYEVILKPGMSHTDLFRQLKDSDNFETVRLSKKGTPRQL